MDALTFYQFALQIITAEFVKELLVLRFRRMWDQISTQLSEADVQKVLRAEFARSRGSTYEFLQYNLLTHPVLIAGKKAEPMVRNVEGKSLIIPAHLIASTSSIRLAKIDDTTIYSRDDWKNAEYVRIQTGLGRTVSDKTVYSAKRIVVEDSTVIIEGGLSKYGSALATQDSLEWEFLLEVGKWIHSEVYSRDDFRKVSQKLLTRLEIESFDAHLLSNLGRNNALAISTVIIFKSLENDYRVLMGKRSSETGSHADLFHVIPACIFQPELGKINEEWDIRHNFLKEYGEELFKEKLDTSARKFNYFYSEWEGVASLLKALDDQKCSFTVTGIVVNLLNFRPEICTLLLVHDSNWWEEQDFRWNREYETAQRMVEQTGKTATDFNLQNVELEFFQYFGSSPSMWVPPGLAAFWLGVDAAREQLRRI